MQQYLNDPDLSLVDGCTPVPLGVSLAWVIVVDYRTMVPRVSVKLQQACNDGDTITLLP